MIICRGVDSFAIALDFFYTKGFFSFIAENSKILDFLGENLYSIFKAI